MDFEDFCVSPLDLVALQVLGELLLGLMFCMWAALTAPGKFLSIHSHSEENRYWCIFICFHFVNWDFFFPYILDWIILRNSFVRCSLLAVHGLTVEF